MNSSSCEPFAVHEFETQYGYYFKNPQLLCEALTHTSYANEYHQKTGKEIPNNERLEFLGDTVMSTIISTRIFKQFPYVAEGKLSKMRSAIVCESALAECFQENGLATFLMLGKGEELTGGRQRPSVLSDCFEAIIGAIYLDGGFAAAEAYIDKVMQQTIEKGIKSYNLSDSKTFLQEQLRKAGSYTPVYQLVRTEGPDHQRQFTMRVEIVAEQGVENPFAGFFGEGTGPSKKEAEQRAAADFLQKGKLDK